ncbi:hypothetical protein [Photobacterium sanguinicancri]|uniref:Uncharacterized protein n=1 Tax=Photobacterium sanguinicancri TaxID=875932 RepID=A0ABX4FW93_9GAMM|nr:hypothetical protein [Photobacterium sanguinicancri]OZS43037.1 hypothetical protein ASV53_15375 [Photobacterium sanguinicancri]
MIVKENGKSLSGKEKGQEYFVLFETWWDNIKSDPDAIKDVTHNYGKDNVTLNKSALGRIFKCDRKKFDTNSQIVQKISEIEAELRSLIAETLSDDNVQDEPEQINIKSDVKKPVQSDNTEDDPQDPDDEENTNAIIEYYKNEVARLNKELRRVEQREINLQARLDKVNGRFKRTRLVHSALTEMGVIIDGEA